MGLAISGPHFSRNQVKRVGFSVAAKCEVHLQSLRAAVFADPWIVNSFDGLDALQLILGSRA